MMASMSCCRCFLDTTFSISGSAKILKACQVGREWGTRPDYFGAERVHLVCLAYDQINEQPASQAFPLPSPPSSGHPNHHHHSRNGKLVSHGKAFAAHRQAKIMLTSFKEGSDDWKDDRSGLRM